MRFKKPKNGHYTCYCYGCKHYAFERQVGCAYIGTCSAIEGEPTEADAYDPPCGLWEKRGKRGKKRMSDLISRQAAIKAIIAEGRNVDSRYLESERIIHESDAVEALSMLPSAQPETPPYVAEIESEYKKWVSMPHINKPLAKALYEVWKKHDREDVSRPKWMI